MKKKRKVNYLMLLCCLVAVVFFASAATGAPEAKNATPDHPGHIAVIDLDKIVKDTGHRAKIEEATKIRERNLQISVRLLQQNIQSKLMKLAREIVTIYHGQEEAEKAEAEFVRVFQEQGQPEEMDEYKLKPGQSLLDVLEAAKLVESRSQARRMIQQGAVRLDDRKLDDPHAEFPGTGVLQVGKRHFIRII